MADTALTMRRDWPRPDPADLAALDGIPTGFLVDAMGRRGALDPSIRPVFARERFLGPALTVWAGPRDNLAPYAALTVARPGDVLVVATGAYTGSAVLGDLAIGMARNSGVVAIVTDGHVRDIEGIEAVGIPVFARGLTPNSPEKNGPGEVGGRVALGGVPIEAGDVVAGDRDGVVVVPRARLSEVRAALEAVKQKEVQMDAAVKDGLKHPTWLLEAMERRGVRWLD